MIRPLDLPRSTFTRVSKRSESRSAMSARPGATGLARWVRGAAAFEGQLGLYRQYAINHEVGHVFDNPHVPCPETGGLAPIMMQQSFGTANDYLAQLTEENPQGTQIPRDGKVCRPNAWPYPQGAVTPAG